MSSVETILNSLTAFNALISALYKLTDGLSPVVAEVLSECRLLSYMSQMSVRMSFLFRLINIIHVQTLTQVKNNIEGP